MSSRLITAASILAVATTALAEPYENVPTGSRTAAMGGAGVAGGSDSAMPMLNPAGLALIPGSIASLSASLYQLSVSRIPSFYADGGNVSSQWGTLALSDPGVESVEFGSFPSGIAYFLHVGSAGRPMTLAASLSVPRTQNRRFLANTEYRGEGVSVKSNTTTIIQEQLYLGALSWAAGFGALRVGASVLGAYTSFLRTTDQSELVVLGTFSYDRRQTKEAQAITSFDLGAMLGAQVELGEHFALGLGVRSPSIHLGGEFTKSVDFTAVSSDGDPFIATIQGAGEARRGFPLRVAFGAQLSFASWALALDGTAFLPLAGMYSLRGAQISSSIGGAGSESDDVRRETEVEVPTQPSFGANLGFEYRVTEANWLRAGVYTELSGAEPASKTLESFAGRVVAPEILFTFPIHRFGGSIGWGTRIGPIDTTFGVRGTFGAGDTVRIAPDTRYQPRTALRGDTTRATLLDALVFISAAVDVSEGLAELKKIGAEP